MISIKSNLGKRSISTTRPLLNLNPEKPASYLANTIQKSQELKQSLINNKPKVEIINHLIPRFSKGQIYDPFDFSIAKINLERKFAKQDSKNNIGIFDRKRLNPLNFYTNPIELSKYLTTTGRIQPRDVTKLSVKNQKRLAKAVKRARSVGFLSSVHRDVSLLLPEITHKK
ncbi:hypothetical protein WICMUC_004693 [Wickerhamomyces mucosus]|uniref:Small ribosomal subunit protein bS18m n=1 Tax=Wickerhamomyces mucosus TaxID=1378264 RepID=A0A9P8PG98_9ASCO|nr:hypothetical protein WICMUC_004693 [Wickerhamomyces mucosus]